MNETLDTIKELLLKNDIYLADLKNMYSFTSRIRGSTFDFLKLIEKIKKTDNNLFYFTRDLEPSNNSSIDASYCFVDTGLDSQTNEPIVFSCIRFGQTVTGTNMYSGKIVGVFSHLITRIREYSTVSENELSLRAKEIAKNIQSARKSNDVPQPTQNTTSQPGQTEPSTNEKTIPEMVIENNTGNVYIFDGIADVGQEQFPTLLSQDQIVILYANDEDTIPLFAARTITEKKLCPLWLKTSNKINEIMMLLGYLAGRNSAAFKIYSADQTFESAIDLLKQLPGQGKKSFEWIPLKHSADTVKELPQEPTPNVPATQTLQPVQTPSPVSFKKPVVKTPSTDMKKAVKDILGDKDQYGELTASVVEAAKSAKDVENFKFCVVEKLGPVTAIPLMPNLINAYKQCYGKEA